MPTPTGASSNRSTWRTGVVAAALLAVATSAAGAEATPYPIALRLAAAGSPDVTYTREPAATSSWPPQPAGTANLSAQARAAYGAVANRAFQPGTSGDAELVLAIAIGAAVLESRATGSMAVVEHQLTARTTAGEELGAWRTRGEAVFVGGSEAAMNEAFAHAATEAAADFEERFAEPPGIRAWLSARGVSARAPVGRVRRSTADLSDRGTVSVLVEPTIARTYWGVEGAYTSWSAADSTTLGLRAGVAASLLVATVTYAHWTAEFEEDYGYSPGHGSAGVTALGLDLAPRLRLAPVEFQLGVGLQRIWMNLEYDPGFATPQTISAESAVTALSLFGRLGLYTCKRARTVCFTGGLELRVYATEPDPMGPGTLALTLDPAKASLGVWLRVEKRIAPAQ